MFKLVEDTYYNINDLESILDEAIENGIITNNQKINYYNIICALDIETSSFTDKPTKEDHNEKRSLMYIWQLAINGRVIVGREWSEFLYCMNKIVEILDLNKQSRLMIFVHNFSYEFQFIRKFFNWYKVFAISTRKPIYGITENGFEFRCSYILSNKSLAKLGDDLQKYKVSKMVGDLDYKKIRTPLTPLSKEEMQYCINDVLVVSAYIKECQETERYLYRIPYTATGYCRRYVRHNCLYSGGKKYKQKQSNKYHAKMLTMQITDIEEYKQLKRAFSGGFTHAAAEFSGMTVIDVDSIDFTSSYPFVLLSEQFPMGTGRVVTIHNNAEFKKYLKHYFCIFDCRFYDLKPKFKYESYLSVSKCFQKTNYINNNGRIYSADIAACTLTNIDFDIIEKVYTFSKCQIMNFRIYKKAYLPKEIITSIIKLYKDKTVLKGVKGKETEYQLSKGLLNSVYGMMVTDIIRDDIVYKDDEWTTEAADVDKLINKYNKSRRRFLFYPWGVACTAYARRNIWSGILEFKHDYIYSDTDSIKCINLDKHQKYINAYNTLCENKLKLMCKHYDIDYNDLLPKTIKGEVKPLGVYDHDGHYDKFKTLGAKRYMVLEDGKLSITVSGVNKKTAVPYLLDNNTIDDCFMIFNEGLIIPPDQTGKLTHCYIDKPYKGTVTDYRGVKYDYETLSGIYLEGAEYNFDISVDYINFLKGYFYTK